MIITPPNGLRLSCAADSFQIIQNETRSFCYVSSKNSDTFISHEFYTHRYRVSLSRWLGGHARYVYALHT
jgi:hypothetical protein